MSISSNIEELPPAHLNMERTKGLSSDYTVMIASIMADHPLLTFRKCHPPPCVGSGPGSGKGSRDAIG